MLILALCNEINSEVTFVMLLAALFLSQILLDGRPEHGSGNSVAIFEIHIVPGYCIGQYRHYVKSHVGNTLY